MFGVAATCCCCWATANHWAAVTAAAASVRGVEAPVTPDTTGLPIISGGITALAGASPLSRAAFCFKTGVTQYYEVTFVQNKWTLLWPQPKLPSEGKAAHAPNIRVIWDSLNVIVRRNVCPWQESNSTHLAYSWSHNPHALCLRFLNQRVSSTFS